MNEQTRWRYAFAERIAASYARNANAQVVMIAGSVGRDRADRHSDIEIDVYYSTPPTVAERTAAVTGCGGAVEGLDEDDDEWEEQLLLGGVRATSSTFLISTMERYLHEIVDRGDIAPDAQTRLSSLQQATTVKGFDCVERWRAKAASYPTALVYAMLRDNLVFDGFWYAEDMLAERDDILALYEIFVRIERQIIGALLGLNRMYLPAPSPVKWMDEMIGGMSLAPDHLSQRLKLAFRLEPQEGVRSLKELIRDVLRLVELHVPEFDIAPYRANFAKSRPAQDRAPGGR